MLKKMLLVIGILPFPICMGIWIHGYWNLFGDQTKFIEDRPKHTLGFFEEPIMKNINPEVACDTCIMFGFYQQTQQFFEKLITENGLQLDNFEVAYYDTFSTKGLEKSNMPDIASNVKDADTRVVGLSLISQAGQIEKNYTRLQRDEHIHPARCTPASSDWNIEVRSDDTLVPRGYIDNCLHQAEFRFRSISAAQTLPIHDNFSKLLKADRFDGMRLYTSGVKLLVQDIMNVLDDVKVDTLEQTKLERVLLSVFASFLLCMITCGIWIVMAVRTTKRLKREKDAMERATQEETERKQRATNDLLAMTKVIEEVLVSPLNPVVIDDYSLSGELRQDLENTLVKLRLMKLTPGSYGLDSMKEACDQYQRLMQNASKERIKIDQQRGRIRERIIFAQHHSEYASKVDGDTRRRLDEFLEKIQARDSIKPRELGKIEYEVDIACKRLAE